MTEKKICVADTLAALRLAVASTAFLLAAAGTAQPHDDAKWIEDGRYRAQTGELCCGPTDCGAIPASDVRHVPDGYIVRGYHVPFSETLPSTDGQYWGCTKPAGIRCFFAPLMG